MTVRNTQAEQARRAGIRPQDITKPPPKPKTEGQISKQIRDWIDKIGGLATRVNVGVIKLPGRIMQLAPAGTSDSLSILSVRIPNYPHVIGIYVAIEIKKPGGVTSIKQQEFIEKIRAKGGIAFWADSLASAKEQLATALHERGLELWSKSA